MDEARLEDAGTGLSPVSDGWFVVNVAETEWMTSDVFGSGCVFESHDAFFPQLGINIAVMMPGEPNCLYHSESLQEAFLVLSGECTLLVEGEERALGQWDFFHCPPGTEHVLVGAGEGPCVVLMAGARAKVDEIFYPRSELAARYGASAEKDTPDPKEAYARFERPSKVKPAYWDQLPWA
jgi:uncharacterized cupin superfamily protein